MTMNTTGINDLPSLSFSANRSIASLLDFIVLVGSSSYTFNSSTGPVAAECILELCIQSYTAHEINTTFIETPRDAPILLSHDIDSGLPYSSGAFSFDSYAARNLQLYLADTFTGAVSQHNSLSGTIIFPSPVDEAVLLALNSTPPPSPSN